MLKFLYFFLPLFFPLSTIAQDDDWLKTHILRMKEGLVLKLSQLIEYQIRKNFMVKICRKYAPEASLRLLFGVGK